jgi:hypothetical protein
MVGQPEAFPRPGGLRKDGRRDNTALHAERLHFIDL